MTFPPINFPFYCFEIVQITLLNVTRGVSSKPLNLEDEIQVGQLKIFSWHYLSWECG
jgi:hypothetical protein